MEKEAAERPREKDRRRAAAITLHHSRRDIAGVNAVLSEASDENRCTELILAVLDLFQVLVPALHTPPGRQLLAECVVGFAAEEGEQS